ncbi:DgyrCDS1315 [Dimorphilus gyrociliatus]|uniref:DgyrCDS1315 n=1 Tax=Dimorphilus gyrociliatus TaxID=2664684 RepID=A0A7I8VA23_9ANNE|nr:DgyrCDS1315 [Dimorphilus gyrociliatus]
MTTIQSPNLPLTNIFLCGSIISTVCVGIWLFRTMSRKRQELRVVMRSEFTNSFLLKFGYLLYINTPLGNYLFQKSVRRARRRFGNRGHSITQNHDYGELNVLPIAIAEDNYSYLVVDKTTMKGILIDPSDPDVVVGICKRLQVDLTAILCTHKHWDHAGGNKVIKHLFPKIQIFGSIEDKPLATTDFVRDGDSLSFDKMQFQVITTPGHTLGHCVFVLNGRPFNCPDHIFTGDLLFQGGMGKIFEGDHTLMIQSLDKIMMFNNNTLIWPGHEYSKHCLRFACYIDPDNVEAASRWDKVETLRRQALSSVSLSRN